MSTFRRSTSSRRVQTILIGLVALAAAFVAAAATIPSPSIRMPIRSGPRPRRSPDRRPRIRLRGAGSPAGDERGGAHRGVSDRPRRSGPLRSQALRGPRAGCPDHGHRQARRILAGVSRDRAFSGTVEGDDGLVGVRRAPRRDRSSRTSASSPRACRSWGRTSRRGLRRPLERLAALRGRPMRMPWTCGAEEMPAPLTGTAEPTYPAVLAPLSGMKQAAVRIETEQELLRQVPRPDHRRKDQPVMGAYVATLFGAINVVLRTRPRAPPHGRRGARLDGGTTDPYDGADTLAQLYQLGDWWHPNRPMASYPRAFVHYLSGRSVSGGIAWLSVLCNGDFCPGGAHYGGGYGADAGVRNVSPPVLGPVRGPRAGWATTPARRTRTAITPRSTSATAGNRAATAGPALIRARGKGHDHELLPPAVGRLQQHRDEVSRPLHREKDDPGDQRRGLPDRRRRPSRTCRPRTSSTATSRRSRPTPSLRDAAVAPSSLPRGRAVTREQMAVFLLKSTLDPASIAGRRDPLRRRAGQRICRRLDRGARAPRHHRRVRRRQLLPHPSGQPQADGAFLLKTLLGSDHVPPVAACGSFAGTCPTATSSSLDHGALRLETVTGGCADFAPALLPGQRR